ncbi:MAG: SDR family NAD(P)-dependent oxidoreductase [Deltaproteobacteria bacterium]
MEINNKIALVTGGAKRVGRAIALELARCGAHIAVHYNKSEAEAASAIHEIKSMGREAALIKADLARSDDIERMVDSATERFGGIDILVNSAAIFYRTPLLEISEADWDAFMNVNLKSVFLASQKAASVMLRQRRGKIINIADSDGGINGWRSFIPYSVSKAGVIMLTKTLAKALAPDIEVNAVAPGPVLMPQDSTEEERRRAADSTLLKRAGSPEDVARAVRFLVESDYITGAVVAVDGGSAIK